ncbi:hypothetical protein CANINC_000733, partial [Pichia inconspicua]
STNTYLDSIHVDFHKRWQNWGIFICYIAINIIFMYALYFIARVPKKDNRVQDASALKSEDKKLAATSDSADSSETTAESKTETA